MGHLSGNFRNLQNQAPEEFLEKEDFMEHIRHGIKRIGTSILLLLLTLIMLPAGSAQAATKIKGIDVSRWQGKVDWKKVKASGVEFVMLGIGRYHNGVRVPDTEFTYNITNALANGIHVGVYLYSEAGDVKTAKKEAQFMLDMIDGYKISYPVAFDIEDDVHRKMTTKQRTDITIAFLEKIEKAGYYPMVYASQSWLEYSLDLTRLTRYDKWVARWASATSFRPLSMWQYTNKGKVSGITTNVDLDYSYKDYTKIVTPRTHALTKTDTGSSETEKPSEDVKVQEGWKASGKKYWYQKADGTRAKKGWLTVGEDKFYLDANGYRVSGWKKIGGRYYYFGQKTGATQTGWLKLGSKYYYLKADGTRATGWVKVNGCRYYLDKKGVRKYGWLTVGKKKYLLGTKTGKACTGWTKYRGKIYYFSTQTGQMRKGWLTFGDNKYYTKSNGVRAAGWTKIKGKWYYFNKKNGVMKKSCKVGKYRFDGNGVCANYKK